MHSIIPSKKSENEKNKNLNNNIRMKHKSLIRRFNDLNLKIDNLTFASAARQSKTTNEKYDFFENEKYENVKVKLEALATAIQTKSDFFENLNFSAPQSGGVAPSDFEKVKNEIISEMEKMKFVFSNRSSEWAKAMKSVNEKMEKLSFFSEMRNGASAVVGANRFLNENERNDNGIGIDIDDGLNCANFGDFMKQFKSRSQPKTPDQQKVKKDRDEITRLRREAAAKQKKKTNNEKGKKKRRK